MKTFKNLNLALQSLKTRGFTHRFELKEHTLIDVDTDKNYPLDQLNIEEYHRFTVDGESPRRIIIFAINCADNTRGYVMSEEQDSDNFRLRQFMDKVKVKKRHKNLADPQSDNNLMEQ